ncbi:ribonuclease H-like domain-containing protein [Pontibacter sp. G13]|uniref:ribonuclease H-like domain-containing protein n=1 Tax=Pontibacter sp. G13 TaxID=3074898 RepID=UPI00288C0DAA|nr:ribonuclease H-like domain-containing protein [Pontibacter sp. G13]WNJ21117.1 ribonuclease H-like domain-containing protein [Pontibacter sp. G13]
MFTSNQLENLLFVDIETASSHAQFEDLSERMQKLWERKANKFRFSDPDTSPEDLYAQKAAIFAEFGKVVCISAGVLRFEGDQPHFHVQSYFGPDERKTLVEFGAMLQGYQEKRPGYRLCAHNGKEFDFPYLGRRYMIHGLPIPDILQVQGKKPWETSFVDTMELWKFGDYKSYTSLDLIAAVMDIPSPKDDIDGSMVSHTFWVEGAHERIKNYCEKDVLTTAQVVLKMSRLPLVNMQEA